MICSLYPRTRVPNTHKVEILPLGITDEDHIHGHVHKDILLTSFPPSDLLPPSVDIDVTGYIGPSLPPPL